MKKIFLGSLVLLVIISIGAYYYRLNQEAPDEIAQVDDLLKTSPENKKDSANNKATESHDEKSIVKNAESTVSEESADEEEDDDPDMAVSSGKGSSNPEKEKSLNVEDADKLTAYFEATEKAWNTRMESFIINELGMTNQTVKEYKVLREGLDRDKMEAFEEFHKHMRDKYGDNYSYNPTKDEETFAKKIKEDYEKKLQQVFGVDNFNRYRQFRNDFNKNLKDQQNPEMGTMMMDL